MSSLCMCAMRSHGLFSRYLLDEFLAELKHNVFLKYIINNKWATITISGHLENLYVKRF